MMELPAEVEVIDGRRRYVLGALGDQFGVWDRRQPEHAIELFPGTDEGYGGGNVSSRSCAPSTSQHAALSLGPFAGASSPERLSGSPPASSRRRSPCCREALRLTRPYVSSTRSTSLDTGSPSVLWSPSPPWRCCVPNGQRGCARPRSPRAATTRLLGRSVIPGPQPSSLSCGSWRSPSSCGRSPAPSLGASFGFSSSRF